jgi:hypothetical protein
VAIAAVSVYYAVAIFLTVVVAAMRNLAKTAFKKINNFISISHNNKISG